jgi:hypothetical protein
MESKTFQTFIIIALIIIWIWYLLQFGAFGFMGGTGQLDYYNSLLESTRQVAFLQHLPDVINEDDSPLGNRKCVDPMFVMGLDDYEEGMDCKCSVRCREETATQYLVHESDNIFTQSKKLKPGVYCQLDMAKAACNTSTTNIVYSASSWSCFPKGYEFGGIGGNKIMICGGQLKDLLLETTHDQYIPWNLSIDLSEKLENGEYRFQCPLQVHPITQYALTPINETNRFIQITNPCTMGITNAMPVAWDSETGKCDCKEPLVLSASGRCTNCPLGRAHTTGISCLYCHDSYLPRLARPELYPCLYGPHLIVKAPIQAMDKNMLTQIPESGFWNDKTEEYDYTKAQAVIDVLQTPIPYTGPMQIKADV